MLSGIVADACVLIDFFRAKEKAATLYVKLTRQYASVYVPTTVLYEVLVGDTPAGRLFWQKMFNSLPILSFTEADARLAATMAQKLRHKNLRMEPADLFIAATAITRELPLATLNAQHFNMLKGIANLPLITG
ncbi:MAG: type II toxin-antitoxin system VapC family toxin [Planctomycetota bacterium]|jgi:predicted nucleic acid-binding protein|nr:type II toxin-antitoxin system VapC family toxin [Planctomycetota bacterium]